MLIEEIKVVTTAPCLAEEGKLRAITKTPVSLNEFLPYLNSVIEKPYYQPKSNSLIFKKGIVNLIIRDDSINIRRFANMTELFEILDWLKDLINDTYGRKSEITPNFKAREGIPALKIYKLLPKKNCKKCGESTCMAFAVKLGKLEAEIEECLLFQEEEFIQLKEDLIQAMQTF